MQAGFLFLDVLASPRRGLAVINLLLMSRRANAAVGLTTDRPPITDTFSF